MCQVGFSASENSIFLSHCYTSPRNENHWSNRLARSVPSERPRKAPLMRTPVTLSRCSEERRAPSDAHRIPHIRGDNYLPSRCEWTVGSKRRDRNRGGASNSALSPPQRGLSPINSPISPPRELLTTAVPVEFEDLAPPLLLPGDRLKCYQMLRQPIFTDLAPQSVIKWMLAIDQKLPGRSSATGAGATSLSRRIANTRSALRRIDLVGIAPELQDQAEFHSGRAR